MRCLSQNKKTIYYALLTTTTRETDSYGNYTGDIAKTYGTPTEIDINVSSARGNTYQDVFGINNNYTKVMVTDDINCPIVETTVLWIGKEPYVNSVLQPYNYIVTQRAESINSVTYAIKEVSVT